MLIELFRMVDLTGVLANAILGGVAAKRVGYDPVGFVVLALVSGLGGGMVRDTLLQQGTPVALSQPIYLVVASLGGIIAFLVPLHFKAARWSLIGLDAVAVGSWAAIGTQKGLAAGLPWPSAVMLGVITVVGGGIIRDVLLQRKPVIFTAGSPLYATCALVASLVTMVITELGHPMAATFASVLVGAGMAASARWFGWALPTEFRAPLPWLWPRQDRGQTEDDRGQVGSG